ncbi:MAG: DUF2520 domain-containing protein [Candidatus Delongbacteria bacterium]|nr:DUF2520 domain-containing protein [bacterium]MBL7032810.1 DUF2520 domain-containing protein [Candidatus Delongbacteria bacterium]
MQSIGIIGVGRAGGSLALSLAARGHQITFLVDPVSPTLAVTAPVYPTLQEVVQPVDLLLAAVPDRMIAPLLQKLNQHSQLRQAIVLHLSGAANLTPFAGIEAPSFRGIGMLHPLFSFLESAMILPPGLLYGCNGDAAGLAACRELVGLLRGKTVIIEQEQAGLYHTLAVMMSNFPQALALMADELAPATVATPEAAELLRTGLRELMLQAVNKLPAADPASELTGPARRGDVTSLRSHLEVLQLRDENLMDLYLHFSQFILRRFATEIPVEAHQECLQLLEQYEKR